MSKKEQKKKNSKQDFSHLEHSFEPFGLCGSLSITKNYGDNYPIFHSFSQEAFVKVLSNLSERSEGL